MDGPTGPRCLTCSEPYERDQQFCLECGARLPSAPNAAHDTPLWAWAAVVTFAMVAIVSGVIIALLASADEGDVARAASPPFTTSQAQTTESTPVAPLPLEQPVTVPLDSGDLEPAQVGSSAEDILSGTVGSAGTPADATDSPAGARQDDLAAPTAPSAPGGGALGADAALGALGEWPGGTAGFTVILASIPESRGRAEADIEAARATAAGLGEVGVLLSSAYTSLRQGYWVAFAGVYGTLNAARAEVGPARAAGFPTAYTRRVAG